MQQQSKISPWLKWLLIDCLYFVQVGIMLYPATAQSTISQATGLSTPQITLFSQCFFLAIIVFIIPAGLLIDRIGARKLLYFSIPFLLIGTILFAAIDDYTARLISRFIAGIGASATMIAILDLSAKWFSKRQFPMVTALTIATNSLSILIFSVIYSLFTTTSNWQHIMYYTAAAVIVLYVLMLIVIKKNDDYVLSDVSTSDKPSIRLLMASYILWLLVLYKFLSYSHISVMTDIWATSTIQSIFKLNSFDASLINSLSALGFFFGAVLFGILCRYVKEKLLILISTSLLFIIMCLGYLAQTIPTISTILFLAGLLIGVNVLIFDIAKRLLPSNHRGLAFAIINMFSFVPTILISPVIAYIVTTNSNQYYWANVPILIAIFMAAIVSILLYRAIGKSER